MEDLYEIWENLSPVDKFFYAQRYWEATKSPKMWYGMNDFDEKFEGYDPIDVVSALQPRGFDIRDNFFKYDEHHLVMSGNAQDVMKDIEEDLDQIIEFNADEL